MYPYRTVEKALAKVHGNTDAAATRVSARVKHFIRLGLTPMSPGKGKRIDYTFDDVAKWHYALEILEYGIDPTAMQSMLIKTWNAVMPFLKDTDEEKNYLLYIVPRAISHPNTWVEFEYTIREADVEKRNWHQTRRLMIINLSGLGFDIRTALAEAEAEETGAKIESVFVNIPGL